MYNEYGELEFTKMAVEESSKGKGFGNLLMQHCIDKAKQMGSRKFNFIFQHKIKSGYITL